MPNTRSFFLPAAGIGLVIAVAFFKVYGRFSRPSVPSPVSAGITAFAPGVAIGKPVKEIKGLPSPYWVQHIGYVSDVNRQDLVQVRYLMPPELRAKPTGDLRAAVDAVELVAPPGAVSGRSQMQFVVARFGTRQKDGCLLPETPGLPRRQVEYWTTKNDRGGMAVIYDHVTIDQDSVEKAMLRRREERMREYELARAAGNELPLPTYEAPPRRFALSSVIFWRGPFEGAKTLRGNFVPRLCAEVETPPRAPADIQPSVVASDSLLILLGYRPVEAAGSP
jgi:hypothetical protein